MAPDSVAEARPGWWWSGVPGWVPGGLQGGHRYSTVSRGGQLCQDLGQDYDDIFLDNSIIKPLEIWTNQSIIHTGPK